MTPTCLAGSVTLAEDRISVESIDLRLGQQTRATVRGQLGLSPLQDPLKLQVNGPISELTANAASQFDPKVVEALVGYLMDRRDSGITAV